MHHQAGDRYLPIARPTRVAAMPSNSRTPAPKTTVARAIEIRYGLVKTELTAGRTANPHREEVASERRGRSLNLLAWSAPDVRRATPPSASRRTWVSTQAHARSASSR